MDERQRPSGLTELSSRIDPLPPHTPSRQETSINVPAKLIPIIVIAGLGLAACKPVNAGTTTPEIFPTGTPAGEVLPVNPTGEVTQIVSETPVSDSTKPSIFEGLFLGQYKNADGSLQIAGQIEGYDSLINTYYREENPEIPAAFSIDNNWLTTYFHAITDKSGTHGVAPDGRPVLQEGNVWVVEETGEIFIPFIPSIAGEPFGYPVITNDEKIVLVDKQGKIIEGGEPREMFQTPAEIAKIHGFAQADAVNEILLADSGILQMFDAQGVWLGEIKFLGDGETINEWIVSHPPSQELITQGMGTKVIRESENVDRLTFDVHASLNDRGERIVFARDPDTQEILLATRVDSTSHEMEWHVAGLRDFADVLGITIGTQLYSPESGLYPSADIKKINALVLQEYNHAIIVEAGLPFTELSEGQFNFKEADDAVNLALANGMTVEGDDLIYGLSDFQYSYLGGLLTELKAQGMSDADIKSRFQTIVVNHIKTVMDHFKGRITEWSALNEWRGQDRDVPDGYSDIFKNDEEFVRLVFQTARDADPNARLFINDADMNIASGYNYPKTVAIIKDLLDQRTIDAVGIQMTDISVNSPPPEQDVIAAMQGFGIPVIVSSATFSTEGMNGTPEEIEQKQADIATKMLDACVQSKVCTDFRFWDGYGDAYSYQGVDAHTTIFDENMEPKQAYFAFREYFTHMIDGQP